MTPPSSPGGTRTRTAASAAAAAAAPTPGRDERAPRPGGGGSGRPPRPPQRPRRRRTVAVANPHRRVRFMLVAAIFVFTVFGAQLLRVQAFDASKTQAAALDKRLATTVTPALRGQILDRNGVVLASSVERKTVYADQKVVPTYSTKVDGTRQTVGVVGAAAALAPLLGTTAEALVPQLMGTQYRVIAKDVTPLAWRQIQALGIPGLYSEPTSARVYPAGMTSAPLVGFVQKDGTAGGGVEVMADAALKGTPGKLVYQRAQDGTIIPGTETEDTAPANGADVHLTIDADLQWFAQNQIANMVTQSQALSGYVVVQEVKTGKLRAVASYPTFDPDNAGKASADALANHAFQDVYEPGSTGKVMSIATSIEQGVVQPTTQLIVPNRLPRAGHELQGRRGPPHAQPHGRGRPGHVEQHRHDARHREGADGDDGGLLPQVRDRVRLGRRLPRGVAGHPRQGRRHERLPALHDPLRPGLLAQRHPGRRGLPDPRQRRRPDPAEPRREHDRRRRHRHPGRPAAGHPGRLHRHGDQGEPDARGGRRPARHGAQGQDRRLPGRRQDRHGDRYDPTVGAYSGYTASFIGYAPADDPQYVVAVTLQRPVQGHFGGQLGAPVFKDVMTYALQKAQIAPTNTVAPVIPLNSTDSSWDPNDPAVLNGEKKTR